MVESDENDVDFDLKVVCVDTLLRMMSLTNLSVNLNGGQMMTLSGMTYLIRTNCLRDK